VDLPDKPPCPALRVVKNPMPKVYITMERIEKRLSWTPTKPKTLTLYIPGSLKNLQM